jgi:hypothetical protein
MTPIAGHTLASDFHRITEADVYLLAANNLTHVGQLFEKTISLEAYRWVRRGCCAASGVGGKCKFP